MDRILEEFSRRYWDCNPGSLFGNQSRPTSPISSSALVHVLVQVLSMPWLTHFSSLTRTSTSLNSQRACHGASLFEIRSLQFRCSSTPIVLCKALLRTLCKVTATQIAFVDADLKEATLPPARFAHRQSGATVSQVGTASLVMLLSQTCLLDRRLQGTLRHYRTIALHP